MTTVRNIFKVVGLYLVLNLGVFLMLRNILEYTALDDHVGFLQAKQDYVHNRLWKAAFYTHVFSSIFTLLAGLTQFSGDLLKNHRHVHRIIGRIYAWDIIFINFPSGLIMAIYANGHLPSKLAFLILDCLWLYFTVKAVVEIKRGNIVGHRDYMTRSYALTFSAITLRTWRLVLSAAFNLDPQLLYMLDAWLGFVPNLLCAEWLIATRKKAAQRPKNMPNTKATAI
jgi:uncharacterized membrane protein